MKTVENKGAFVEKMSFRAVADQRSARPSRACTPMAQKKSPSSAILPPFSSYFSCSFVYSLLWWRVGWRHTPIDDVAQYSCPEQLYSTAVFYHGKHGGTCARGWR